MSCPVCVESVDYGDTQLKSIFVNLWVVALGALSDVGWHLSLCSSCSLSSCLGFIFQFAVYDRMFLLCGDNHAFFM